MKTIKIDGREVGPEAPPYIVAELSGNHNGEIERAFRLLEAAKVAGADAVKLQTYTADTITIDHDSPEFTVKGGLWDGRRLYELYQEAHTPWDWHGPIFERAKAIGLTVFSSPFDPTAIDLLESLDAPAYKIASPEIVDTPLIRQAARTGKPLIISTGAADAAEMADAVAAARDGGCDDLILLHCTAAYPAPPEEANLATIPDMAARFGVLSGLSDHTLDTTVATVAVGLGAVFIEKHFTLSRAEGGVDSAFSLEPEELARLVRDARIAFAARGAPTFHATRSETLVREKRRSLYVVQEMRAGDAFTPENVRSIRPALGLPPKYLDVVLGRTAARDIPFGAPLAADMIAEGLE